MAHFRPYHRSRVISPTFDDYCARIDAYEREVGSGLTGGGATSTGEEGLWDAMRCEQPALMATGSPPK